MNKRQRIRAKTDGHCSYCGVELPEKGWHIDHQEALYRKISPWGERTNESLFPENDSEDNMVPACPRCNRWKSILNPEEFKKEIEMQFDRLYKNSPGFRLAVDYGAILKSDKPIQFYIDQRGDENGT